MNTYCSPTPPPTPSSGDIWYNTDKQEFYVMDGAGRWIAIDDDGFVTDIIDQEDPNEAYDRAMGVI